VLSPSPSETYYTALDIPNALPLAAFATLPLVSSSRQHLFAALASTMTTDIIAQHAQPFGHSAEQVVFTPAGDLSVEPIGSTVFAFTGTAWARETTTSAHAQRDGVSLTQGAPPNTGSNRRLLTMNELPRRRILSISSQPAAELASSYQTAMTSLLDRVLPTSSSRSVLCTGPVFGVLCGTLSKSRPQATMAIASQGPVDAAAGLGVVPLRNALSRTVIGQLYHSQQLFGLGLLSADVFSVLAEGKEDDNSFLVALGIACLRACTQGF
jgi:hypothetical protein